MGVDFYTCENESCSRTYPDCGYYFSCSGCESRFCTNTCGGRQLVEEESDDEVDDDSYHEELTSCILCRKESIQGHEMVSFLLKKLGLTYEQAAVMFREEPEED